MNANHDHITHYSAADIQRYVQGKLSAKEMHAMEKAALDDPFLADAIDGMQQALHDHDESVVTGQLHELQQQFQTRIAADKGKRARIIVFNWWQAAAAAVVLIITGMWIYSAVIKNDAESTAANTSLAQTEKAEQKTTTAQQTNPAEPLHDNKQQSVPTDSSIIEEGNAVATTRDAGTWYKNHKAKARSLQAQAAAPNPSYNSNTQTDTVFADLANRQALKYENIKEEAAANIGVAAAKPAAPDAAARAKKAEHDFGERETELITIGKHDTVARFAGAFDKKLSGFVKGRVTDHRNNPIAYAYLQIPNNNNNFMTDKMGFFNIPVKDSVVNVAVNVAGYETQNFRLQNNVAMNQLQLQPAAVALNEVEVSPLSTKKAAALRAAARNKVPNVMDQDAQPTFGWVAYDQYLEKNKKAPAGYETLTGNVVVSFEVNKKGELSDYKVEQSFAQPFNNEAIRLIKDGPTWTLLKGRKARVTVIVRF